MPRKLLKKFIPNPERISQIKGLGFLSRWIKRPDLWHLHREPVSRGFAVGLFWMSIPMPWQMLPSAITAVLLRANLPLSLSLVWISNPITMPPIFYFNYSVGTWILGQKAQESLGFEMTWHWISVTLGELWMPLYLGSFVVGALLAAASYFGVQLFWRFHVGRSWKARIAKRKAQKNL